MARRTDKMQGGGASPWLHKAKPRKRGYPLRVLAEMGHKRRSRCVQFKLARDLKMEIRDQVQRGEDPSMIGLQESGTSVSVPQI